MINLQFILVCGKVGSGHFPQISCHLWCHPWLRNLSFPIDEWHLISHMLNTDQFLAVRCSLTGCCFLRGWRSGPLVWGFSHGIKSGRPGSPSFFFPQKIFLGMSPYLLFQFQLGKVFTLKSSIFQGETWLLLLKTKIFSAQFLVLFMCSLLFIIKNISGYSICGYYYKRDFLSYIFNWLNAFKQKSYLLWCAYSDLGYCINFSYYFINESVISWVSVYSWKKLRVEDWYTPGARQRAFHPHKVQTQAKLVDSARGQDGGQLWGEGKVMTERRHLWGLCGPGVVLGGDYTSVLHVQKFTGLSTYDLWTFTCICL